MFINIYGFSRWAQAKFFLFLLQTSFVLIALVQTLLLEVIRNFLKKWGSVVKKMCYTLQELSKENELLCNKRITMMLMYKFTKWIICTSTLKHKYRFKTLITTLHCYCFIFFFFLDFKEYEDKKNNRSIFTLIMFHLYIITYFLLISNLRY